MKKRIEPLQKRKWNYKAIMILCAVLLTLIGGAGAAIRLFVAFHTPPAVKLSISSSSQTTSIRNSGTKQAQQTSSNAAETASRPDTTSSQGDAATSSDGKIAYLTFDDGPSEYTPRLLQILQQNSIKATFFITFMGHDTPQNRAWVQQEVADGETIGEHSWTHNYAYIYSNEQISSQT